MSTLTNSLYRQSLFQKTVSRLLPLVGAALPDWMFNPAYKAAFGAYRIALRLLYLRFLISAVATSDKARMHRVMNVFRVMPHSLVGWRGLEATHEVVRRVLLDGTKGALVECGVACGGSAALMGLLMNENRDRTLWLFDSYEGLPEAGIADFRNGVTGNHIRPLPKGSCVGTYKTVEKLLFSKLKLSRERVFMVKGWFQDSLPANSQRIGDISVLRIDADWYDSVRCCLTTLYDHVVAGGFVIIDDYGTCFGAQQAVDEFLTARNLAVPLLPDGRGGIIFQKIYRS